MQEKYIAPEFTLAGDAAEIVLGSSQVGHDLHDELLPSPMEFEVDDIPAMPTR